MTEDEQRHKQVKRPAVKTRHVAAVVAGNALEFYDFLTYAFFAVYIGRAFFPSNDPTASLLSSLVTFGAGFVTRPVGSYVIGRIGDRSGRKPAMVLSFALMGAAIVGIALVPSYARIGVVAPILAIFFRLLQGFALGGDVGPTTAVLLEAAPPERRALYTSFQSASQGLATLAAGFAGFILANLLNEQQLQDYGWRIAFLLGAITVPFALVVRRSLPETFDAPKASGCERTPLRPYLPIALIGVVLLADGTIGTYIRTYLTTYAIATLHMASNIAFAATLVNGIFGSVFCLLAGVLADRYGRKPTMLISSVFVLLLVFPAFAMISHYRTAATLLSATAVLAALSSLSICPMITWLTESLPPSIRSSGVAMIYAISISIFGGTTQYAVAWLIKATGNALAPAWYWTVAGIAGLAAVFATSETAPAKIRGPNAALIPMPGRAGDSGD